MTVTRSLVATAVFAAIVSVVAEVVFIDRSHLEEPFEGSTAVLFWAGFGLAWCVAIVLVSKWAGHAFLMRRHDPYTGEPAGGQSPTSEHGAQDARREEGNE